MKHKVQSFCVYVDSWPDFKVVAGLRSGHVTVSIADEVLNGKSFIQDFFFGGGGGGTRAHIELKPRV